MSRFLLVVYYQNKKRADGGWLTILTNRLGDALLLCVIGLLRFNGQWDIYFVWVRVNCLHLFDQYDIYDYVVISFLLIAA